jgi:hypothetical protein
VKHLSLTITNDGEKIAFVPAEVVQYRERSNSRLKGVVWLAFPVSTEIPEGVLSHSLGVLALFADSDSKPTSQ